MGFLLLFISPAVLQTSPPKSGGTPRLPIPTGSFSLPHSRPSNTVATRGSGPACCWMPSRPVETTRRAEEQGVAAVEERHRGEPVVARGGGRAATPTPDLEQDAGAPCSTSAIVALVLALTVFRVKDPVHTMNSVTLEDLVEAARGAHGRGSRRRRGGAWRRSSEGRRLHFCCCSGAERGRR
jgi:hypothetical protein